MNIHAFYLGLMLVIVTALLWWSDAQFDKGYDSGAASQKAACQESINQQAQALATAIQQARREGREKVRLAEARHKAETRQINKRIQESLKNGDFKEWYEEKAPDSAADIIYGGSL